MEAAIKWYDRVITEFPKSEASRIAYKGKLRTLLGWKESGKYGSSYGIKANFYQYMPHLVRTFAEFESNHPEASTLQAFRYQIAQTYWNRRDWDLTRKWLGKIIAEAGENDSFYRDLAERRLKKVEY